MAATSTDALIFTYISDTDLFKHKSKDKDLHVSYIKQILRVLNYETGGKLSLGKVWNFPFHEAKKIPDFTLR